MAIPEPDSRGDDSRGHAEACASSPAWSPAAVARRRHGGGRRLRGFWCRSGELRREEQLWARSGRNVRSDVDRCSEDCSRFDGGWRNRPAGGQRHAGAWEWLVRNAPQRRLTERGGGWRVKVVVLPLDLSARAGEPPERLAEGVDRIEALGRVGVHRPKTDGLQGRRDFRSVGTRALEAPDLDGTKKTQVLMVL